MALPKSNITKLKGGPAMIYYGPWTFFAKGGFEFDASPLWGGVEIDGYGEVDQVKTAQPISLKFTPDGAVTAGTLAALCRQATLKRGQFTTPVLTVETVDTTDDELDITAHGITAGESGYVATDGTLPAGLSASTLYYFGRPGANSVSLHTTQANAIAGTSKVNMTDSGSGTHSIVVNNVLVIQSINDGTKITIHNAAVDKMPDFFLGTTGGQTVFGEVEIVGLLKHLAAPGDSNSYYTTGTGSFDASTFPTLSNILTQPYEAVLSGASAPWDNIRSRDGFKITFNASIEDVLVDGLGVVARQLAAATAAATFIPTDATESDLLTLLKVQGSGNGLGAKLSTSAADLTFTGTGLVITMNSVNLMKGPARWNMKDRRAGEVTFMTTQEISGGVALALMTFATS